MASGSQRAVITAIAGNGILTVLKFAVAVPTHSAAMMNEAVHSLMDTPVSYTHLTLPTSDLV